jgi:hypothetical protein
MVYKKKWLSLLATSGLFLAACNNEEATEDPEVQEPVEEPEPEETDSFEDEEEDTEFEEELEEDSSSNDIDPDDIELSNDLQVYIPPIAEDGRDAGVERADEFAVNAPQPEGEITVAESPTDVLGPPSEEGATRRWERVLVVANFTNLDAEFQSLTFAVQTRDGEPILDEVTVEFDEEDYGLLPGHHVMPLFIEHPEEVGENDRITFELIEMEYELFND